MPDLKKLITLEALLTALPSWLKSSTKPSYTADEISDTNTTNKFVTSTEKNTWNEKGTYSKPSGGIPKSDLSSLVQSSLDKADSAVQTETDPTVPTWAKQTDKPSYTQDEVTDGTTYKRVTQTEKNAWSGKQNALTTTQMQAVNSGINSTKVDQISTNQENIWYNTDTGVRNAAQITDFTYTAGIEGGNYIIPCAPLTGDIVIKCGSITSTDTDSTTSIFLLYFTDGTTSFQQMSRGTNITKNVSIGAKVLSRISCYPSNNYSNSRNDTITVSNLIVCSKSIYDQDSSYTSGAISNSQLTSSMMVMCDVGAKNLVNHIDLATTLTGNATGITLTPNDDGSITLNGTLSTSSAAIYARCFIKGTIKPNTNYVVLGTDSTNVHVQLLAYDSSGNTTILSNEMGLSIVNSGAYARYEARLWIKAKPSSGTQFSNLKIYPMICEESLFKSNPATTPCALPNYDLTRLEAEDRAALAEEIDAGAKNKCRLDRTYIVNNNSVGTWSGDSYTVSGITFAFNFTNGTIACSGTASAAIFLVLNNDIANYTGKEMAISGCPSGGNYDTGYSLYVVDTSETTILKDIGSGATFTVPNNVKRLKIGVRSGTNMNGKTFKPMLCTLADWKVSQKHVPYRPDWDVIADSIKTVQIANSDFITGNTNFTILSQSTLFKHGSQVFGTLVIQKTDTTKFGDSSVTVGTIKSGYRPVVNLIGQSYYNTDQWGANGFGYSYINTSGIVNVKASSDSSGKYSYVAIPINYMTA